MRASRGEQPPTGRAILLGATTLVGPAGDELAVTRPQVQLVLTRMLWEQQPTTQDALAELLWGDRPLSTHWRGAVRGVLSKVRDGFDQVGLAAEVTTTADGTVELHLPAGIAVDVHEATDAIATARDALAAGRAGRAVDLVGPWVERLQRPFLAAADGDWVRWAHEQARTMARTALVTWTDGLQRTGRAEDALAGLQRWLRSDPLDEAVHHLLIESLLAAGRRTEAVAAYDQLRRVLADELGLGPSAATTALLRGTAAEGSHRRAAGDGTGRPRAEGSGVGGSGELLGRQRELGRVIEAWDATVAAGSPGLVLVRGVSGIGKTRLAAEVAAEVERRGEAVLWSRCAPGRAPAFEPLARTLAGSGTPAGDELRGLLDRHTAAPEDPVLARGRIFDLAATALDEQLARPTLLVVDDVQWADDDNLTLLDRLVTGARGPLLVLATGRELPERVHDLVSRLAREVRVATVPLTGLTADDLLPLFADHGPDPSDGAARLHRRTGGHPFFVAEIAGAAARAGAPIDVDLLPSPAREWIEHRLDALPRALRSRLDLAAVLGPELRVQDLASSAQAPQDEVLDQLDELVERGFLVEGDAPGQVAFPHLIAQEAVYDRLGPTRRARLHAAAAEGLLTRHPEADARIAEHLRAAGPDHADAAARHFVRAGDDACRRGAWALAEQLQRAALDVGPTDPSLRCAALTGLARALHLQGDRTGAEDHVDEALDLARRHDLPCELAEAVLVLVGRAGRGASRRRSDLEQVELLEEALAALAAREPAQGGASAGPSDDPAAARRLDALRCRVEVELAIALSLWAPIARRQALAGAALARARAVRPPDHDLVAATLLGARATKLDADQLEERLADQAEVLAMDPAARGLEVTLTAHTYRHEDLLRCGDRTSALAELDRVEAIAGSAEHPYWRWAAATWRALDAIVAGELDEAERLAFTAIALAEEGEPGAAACLGVNLVDIRLYQGRSGEVLDLLAGAADAHPEIPCYRAVLALCAAEAGEHDLAAASLDPFATSAFRMIPDDTNRLLTLAVLADTAVALGRADLAPAMADLLGPYGGQLAVLNCYGGGGAWWGPVDHQLGRLALATGDREAAATHLASAHTLAARVGSPLATARIERDLAALGSSPRG